MDALDDPAFGPPRQDHVLVVGGCPGALLLGAEVVVDKRFGAAVMTGFVMHIPRRHRVTALTAQEHALQRIDPPALGLAQAARLADAVRRLPRLFLAHRLRHLPHLARDQRLMRSRNDAEAGFLGKVADVLVLAVEFDLADVAAVAQQIADGADAPQRLAARGGHLMRLQPVPHRKIRAVLDVGPKHLLQDGGFVRIRREHLGYRVAGEAKGHEAALMQALLLAHSHLDAHLLRGLVALVGLSRHDHRLHEPPSSSAGIGGVVEGDELDAVRLELAVQGIEVAAPREAVIPGAEHTLDLPALHQMAHLGQARTTQRAGGMPLVLDDAIRFPAAPQALGFQLLDLRVTTGVVAARLLFGANAGIQHHFLQGARIYRSVTLSSR